MKKEIDWQTLAAKLFCALALCAALTALPTVVFSALMPFALSFLVGFVIISAARRLSAFAKIGERACRMILLFSSFVLLSGLLVAVSVKLYGEIKGILAELLDEGREAPLVPLLRRLGISEERAESVVESSRVLAERSLGSICDALGRTLTKWTALAPSAVLSLVAFVTSCIYFCLDYEKIIAFFASLLPERAQSKIICAAKSAADALWGYFRAYALLFALTFGVAFIGLRLILRESSFAAAFFVALVDLLPILGTGIILVPWGIISLASGDFAVGIGLLTLYAVITVARAFAEPRIIGESIGLSPMLSLVSVYVGFKLFGVWGMIFTPVATAVLREMISQIREGK